jgi:hypothetical protein
MIVDCSKYESRFSATPWLAMYGVTSVPASRTRSGGLPAASIALSRVGSVLISVTLSCGYAFWKAAMDADEISPPDGDMIVSVPGLMSLTFAGVELPPPPELQPTRAAAPAAPATAPKPLSRDRRVNSGELTITVYSSKWNLNGEFESRARIDAWRAPAGTTTSAGDHERPSLLDTAP